VSGWQFSASSAWVETGKYNKKKRMSRKRRIFRFEDFAILALSLQD